MERIAIAAGEIQPENRPLGGRSDEGVGSAPAGTLHGVRALLADPIVRALMTADRVDPESVEALMRIMAARLSDKIPPS